MKRPKIVVIGGGTGSFAVLSGLKKLNCDLTAVVSMVDDGGSTGILRDELGVLPPGDVRQCLVALSKSSNVMRKLFNFRFRTGSLKGHSFGNLFLISLEKVTGSFRNAVIEASNILAIRGKVLPVTLENTRLFIKIDNGKILEGEKYLDSYDFSNQKIKQVFLKPKVKINPDVKDSLKEADLVVIAPGTLHGSLIPNFLVFGFSSALKNTKAKIIYVCNLMSIAREKDFFLEDYVDELEKYLGRSLIDFVLFNIRKPPTKVLLEYKKEGEEPVKIGEIQHLKNKKFKVVKADFISNHFRKTSNSKNLVRHDKEKLAKAILKIYGK